MRLNIIIAALLITSGSYAQQQSTIVNGKLTPLENPYHKTYLKDIKNLDSLSNVYFNMGDEEFLIIDAFKDGLVKLNSDAAFKYENHILTLNNLAIPEPYNSKYLEKIAIILKKENRDCKSCTTRFVLGPGEGTQGETPFVFPPQDEFKTAKERFSLLTPTYWQQHEHYDSLLIQALLANHIITEQTNDLYIRYNAYTIYINNEMVKNGNIIATCKNYLGYIQPYITASPSDFFGIHFDKKDIARYCKQQ